MKKIILLTFGLSLAIITIKTGQALAGPLGMLPHKALYDVSLSSVKSSGQLLDIKGRMFFEWKKDCDAWVTDHRSTLVYDYADGTSASIKSRFASHETLDGQNLNFSARRESNGNVTDEFRGYANLKDSKAQFSVPKNLEFKLPPETLFPMAHTNKILSHIKTKDRFFNATLFDGSDDTGPQFVNTFIGKVVSSTKDVRMTPSIDKELLKVPAHHVRMAFFPVKDDGRGAEYEMDMTVLDNGVVSGVQITYDTFTLTQKLAALQPVDAVSCRNDSVFSKTQP
jgi:hypothetical protein